MSSIDMVMSAAGAASGPTYVEDVFSTYLYTGNGSTQTITNGIDLAGKGGMVWGKQRNGTGYNIVVDTVRGITKLLETNTSAAQQTYFTGLGSFTSTGFSFSASGDLNNTGVPYTSWTFRKAPKFFDVVTYTGNGSTQTINHNLGQAPGMIIVKCTSQISNWIVYHRSTTTPNNYYLSLNTTTKETDAGSNRWQATSTTFQADVFSLDTNNSGATYVAYLFAHDTTTDGLIQCGSYTGNGSATGPSVTLGWEPQYLMIKNASGTGNWQIIDSMRGMPVGSADATLQANLNNAESSVEYVSPTATGFQVTSTSSEVNTSGSTYIYMAIRRGPMRTPTDATKVFQPILGVDSSPMTTGFPVDMLLDKAPANTTNSFWVFNRLCNQFGMQTGSTAIEADAGAANRFASNTTTTPTVFGSTSIVYSFRRAPGFFDVVCYTGVGSGVAIPHNLGTAPQMIIVKNRGRAGNPFVVWTAFTGTAGANLSGSGAFSFANMSPTVTSSTITYGGIGYEFNYGASDNYVAYLFASCPGVSKVGSYTGNGTSQTINCGFTNGARFVLIKRTDSTGDWYVWDTARGIVAATDPHLSLNTTAAEVTTDDSVDPDASGFIVNQDAATNINVTSATYIYLAIA